MNSFCVVSTSLHIITFCFFCLDVTFLNKRCFYTSLRPNRPDTSHSFFLLPKSMADLLEETEADKWAISAFAYTSLLTDASNLFNTPAPQKTDGHRYLPDLLTLGDTLKHAPAAHTRQQPAHANHTDETGPCARQAIHSNRALIPSLLYFGPITFTMKLY